MENLGPVPVLPDSPAAGRQCSPRNIPARTAPTALAEPASTPISRARSLAKPPLAKPPGAADSFLSGEPPIGVARFYRHFSRVAFLFSEGGKSQSWIAYRLCFGRFLNFTPTGVKTNLIPPNLLNFATTVATPNSLASVANTPLASTPSSREMFSSDRRFLFRVFLFSILFHAPSRASREARENERGHGMAIGHRMGTRWYPWTGRGVYFLL